MPDTIPTQEIFDAKDVEENKLMAALSYLWIMWLVPLLIKRDSAYTQYHAKQGLMLFIAESLSVLISWIPVVNICVFIFLIFLAVIGITNALKGAAVPLPVVGKFVHYLK